MRAEPPAPPVRSRDRAWDSCNVSRSFSSSRYRTRACNAKMVLALVASCPAVGTALTPLPTRLIQGRERFVTVFSWCLLHQQNTPKPNNNSPCPPHRKQRRPDSLVRFNLLFQRDLHTHPEWLSSFAARYCSSLSPSSGALHSVALACMVMLACVLRARCRTNHRSPLLVHNL